MSIIILPNKDGAYNQPTRNGSITIKGQYKDRLVSSILGSSNTDIVTGGGIYGNTRIVETRYGKAFGWPLVSNLTRSFDLPASSDFTVVFSGRLKHYDIIYNELFILRSGNEYVSAYRLSGPNYGLRITVNNSYLISTGSLSALSGGGANIIGAFRFKNATSADIWLNGTQVSTTTHAIDKISTTYTKLGYTPGNYFGDISSVSTWSRYLDDSELIPLLKDPYDLFYDDSKFSKTVYYIPSSGGSTNLTPPLLTNTNTFYTCSVTADTVNIEPSLYTNTNVFYNPDITPSVVVLYPTALVNTSVIYAPTLSVEAVTLSPSLFTNANTFYAHAVTPGIKTLAPSLLANANTFYTPILSTGDSALAPPLLANVNTFYTHVITPGVKTLTPSLLVNSNVFYAHSIAGAGGLLPSLFVNNNVFYTQTVTPGQVELTPSLYANSNTFYAHEISNVGVSQELTPSLFVNSNNFYISAVSSDYPLAASLLNNQNVIYNAALSVGSVNLSASLFTNSVSFYQHLVGTGGHDMYPLEGIDQTYKLNGLTQTYPLAGI